MHHAAAMMQAVEVLAEVVFGVEARGELVPRKLRIAVRDQHDS